MNKHRKEMMARKRNTGRGPFFKQPAYQKPEPEYDVAKTKRGKVGLITKALSLVGL